MPESEKLPIDPDSKTSRKRDIEKLRKLATLLIDLPASQLAKLQIPEDLLELIQFAHTLKAHGAKKRHLQFITKKMRDMDLEQIQSELSKLAFVKTTKTAEFHAAEEWRDKLIAEGDVALQDFLKLNPAANIQEIRQLIRKAQQDQKKGTNTGADKQLFRHLMSYYKE